MTYYKLKELNYIIMNKNVIIIFDVRKLLNLMQTSFVLNSVGCLYR